MIRLSISRCVGALLLLCWLALTLPAAAQNVAPVVSTPLPVVAAVSGTTVGAINLNTYFTDPDVAGTAVRLSMVYSTGTNAAVIVTGTHTIDIALYDTAAPITVANFLTYVTSKDYDGSFLHRSVPGFIIQGGGFNVVYTSTSASISTVTQRAAITNEYSPTRSNIAGTVAMAKLGSDPNSATNQWFINLADNSSNLDNQNGGFTVFGRVVGNGMTVAHQIEALPVFDLSAYLGNGAFNNFPLGGRAATDVSSSVTLNQLVWVNTARVIPALTYSATSSNTSVVTPAVSGSGTLSLLTNRVGSALVTVTATDLDGASVLGSFTVNVAPPIVTGTDSNGDHIPDNWQTAYGLSTTGNIPGLDTDKDGIPDFLEYALGTNPTVSDRSGLPQIQKTTVNGIDYAVIQFKRRRGAALSYIVQESTDLVGWQTVDQTANAVGTVTDLGNGFDQVTVHGNNALSGAGKVGKSFLRLKVVSQ